MSNEAHNTASCQTAVSGSVIYPQDLRIGNILKTPRGVKSINSVGFKDTVNNSRDYYATFDNLHEGYFLDYCEAIQISEELLLKIGAVKLDFKGFPSFNLKGLQINFINGLWIEYVSRVEIKGLHFLQNIFYFRKSEELDVYSLTDR